MIYYLKRKNLYFLSKGLIKLEEKAFVDLKIDKLRNETPIERKSAIADHKKAGPPIV